MDDEIKAFQEDCAKEIQLQGEDLALKEKSLEWLLHANSKKYSYHFSWMGRPIIQYPQDIQMMQELVMRVKPDLIIETGIAHGGSALFSASMLALLDLSDALQSKQPYDPLLTKRKVIAIDIDIREHNKKQILENPFSTYLEMIQGSSIDASVVERVSNEASKFERVMIFLDSNHTHEHVLKELDAYANLTSIGSYIVAFDTVIEDLPDNLLPNSTNPSHLEARTYSSGNSPKSAVREFLKNNPNFSLDTDIDNKLLISVAPEGYLKRIK
ncbi:cephalosporin hydroxylase family protein [Gammaproteobacteria bacterium]|nr:cephalosporin hydroxylase family protein [Gammaproteobacteria bacterium]